MDSKKLAELCRDYADNKKAENIVILDVRDLSSVTDFFVIASGTSEPHLRAIVGELTDRLREEHDVRPMRTDGSMQGAWVILDFFDVIIHVMRQDARERARGCVRRNPGQFAYRPPSHIEARSQDGGCTSRRNTETPAACNCYFLLAHKRETPSPRPNGKPATSATC